MTFETQPLKIFRMGERTHRPCYKCLIGEPITGRNEIRHYHDVPNKILSKNLKGDMTK